ncbi:MAG: NAD(P)H-binding protein [Deltaproteobacteria bacterium]|nr:NAD(P)H-binding protein [Deltaproteobacteria bacterium]
MSHEAPSAVVLGATGLVGSALLAIAAPSGRFQPLRALVRRPFDAAPPGVEVEVVNFDALDRHAPAFAVDHVFCCLGTTIKKAGSQAEFRRVDLEYPLAAARTALAAGAQQFLIVTAVGASSSSRIFYNRVKGELEDALRDLAFPGGVVVLNPSLLLGERHERRVGEAVASAVMRTTRSLFGGPLARYRAIEAVEVARALLRCTESPTAGFRTFEGAPLFDLAR